MKLHCLLLAACVLTLPFSIAFAQSKAPIKFGKVSPEDFDLSKQHFDTGVSAVVIADVGSSYFEGNTKGWFTLRHKRQKRVKILNKNGFDAANVDVLLFSKNEAEEKLENLKAITYNLENGKVVETKLGDEAVFKEKISRNLVRKKFTFPAVKEGSVIEFSYTLSSDFLFNLQPWTFQGEYPCLWSEYQVSMPEFFNYVYLSQGYHPFFIKTTSNSYQSFNVVQNGESATSASEHVAISGTTVNTRWVMKDVPPMKEEAFTSTMNNHVAKVEFQLSQYRFPNTPVKDIMGNWVTVSEELMKDEEFGAPIDKANNWLDDDIKAITGAALNPLEKAGKLYAYVRDNFTCTSHDAVKLHNTLKNIFKSRNGTVADINLLLVAMLRHEHISADPVLLSTREHGFAHDLYPLMDRYNYVVTSAAINDKVYYLDASRPSLGFGKLASDCYNGPARVIGAQPRVVEFMADSLMDRKTTLALITNDDKGGMSGSLTSSLGYMESTSLRQRIRKEGETEFIKKMKLAYGSGLDIEKTTIDSLKKLEEPVCIHFDFAMSHINGEDIIYFNPLMGQGYKDNLFKAAERNYPVEMPYAFDEIFVLDMEVPKNYVVDELPKSAKVKFNEDEGMFEYIVAQSNGHIQLRSRILMKKANFLPEDYNTLREFFGYVVKKHSEQIVFKKIKT